MSDEMKPVQVGEAVVKVTVDADEAHELAAELAATDEPSVMISGGSVLVPVEALKDGTEVSVSMTVTVRLTPPAAPEPASESTPQRRYMGRP